MNETSLVVVFVLLLLLVLFLAGSFVLLSGSAVLDLLRYHRLKEFVCFKKTLRLLPKRRGFGFALSTGFLVFLVPVILPVVLRVDDKSRMIHSHNQAETVAREIYAEQQFEDHTCGLHAINTLYRAYGLEPDLENLRNRMGVDVNAVIGDETTKGTLHFDMYRVLQQDGFEFESPELSMQSTIDIILGHLDQEQMGLFLIQRRENGNLHWVAVGKGDGSKVQVYDSLQEEPTTEYLEEYLRNCAVTVTLVSPAENGNSTNLLNAYALALKDMGRTAAVLRSGKR